MANTPILGLPQVATNQNQKETTINSALAILEAACNDEDAFSLAGGNLTLNATQFTRAFHLQFSGQTQARNVTIPGTVRFFAVSNDGAYNIVVKTAGVGSTVTVEPNKRVLLISDGVNVVSVSAGVSLLSSLTDVVGAGDAAEGQLLRYDADTETWEPAYEVEEHGFHQEAVPTASQVLYRRVVTQPERLLSDFSGSAGWAGVTATATTVLQVFKNATLVGTITFAAGQASPTFSTDTGSGPTTVTLAPGDRLSIVAPATPDATLASFAATLKAVVQ